MIHVACESFTLCAQIKSSQMKLLFKRKSLKLGTICNWPRNTNALQLKSFGGIYRNNKKSTKIIRKSVMWINISELCGIKLVVYLCNEVNKKKISNMDNNVVEYSNEGHAGYFLNQARSIPSSGILRSGRFTVKKENRWLTWSTYLKWHPKMSLLSLNTKCLWFSPHVTSPILVRSISLMQ